MGLLDQFKAYIQANTPRATTPRVSPGKVINEGLLNPNQFNAPAANRFKDSLFGMTGIVPGVGDVASGVQAADFWNRGEKLNAGLSALGVLPIIPSMFIGRKGMKNLGLDEVLAEAEKMNASGVPDIDIWNKTAEMAKQKGVPGGGITYGSADKTPKFDLATNDIPIKQYLDMNNLMEYPFVKDAFPASNYFKAYPELADLRLAPTTGNYDGMYDEAHRIVEVKPIKHGDNIMQASNARKKIAVHELVHGAQQLDNMAVGGSPDQFNMQKEAERARDILVTRNELLRLKKQYPQADTMNLLNKLVEDYQSVGAMDMLPSRIARDAASQPSIMYPHLYPDDTAVSDFQDLVNLYGLDKRTSPYTGKEQYNRLTGEVEARLAAIRADLTPEQLTQNYPFAKGPYGIDVPVEDQLKIFEVSGKIPGQPTGLLSYADEAKKVKKVKK